MTFAAVVFGSYVVGTGFTDGSTSSVGLAVYIKPTANIGNAPLDVGITYIDQSGNAPEVTTITTPIPANTTAGTHIKIVLNTGDTGIEDITAISVSGGTAGDAFNLESWNEGAGKALSIAPRSDANPVWEDTEPTLGGFISRIVALQKQLSDYNPAPSPQMNGTIHFVRGVWDSFSPEPVRTTAYAGKTFAFVASSLGVFTGETLSGHEYNGKKFPLSRSLFGNILAGYLRLPSGTLITDGFKVLFKNSYGFSVIGKCYPTGVYQVLLDLQIYDASYLLVGSTALEIYYQYGAFYVDGSLNQLTSKDLFFLPDQEAHVIGFKKKRLFA